MIYDWFFVFNLTEFTATGLISRTYNLNLEGVDPAASILITKGNLTGLTYEGVFLPLELNDMNPFKFENKAVYVDTNENVWIGFLQDEDED